MPTPPYEAHIRLEHIHDQHYKSENKNLNTRKLLEVFGGNRKKYKKSPRRKTIRKTRRHK